MKFISSLHPDNDPTELEDRLQNEAYRKSKAAIEYQQRITGDLGDKWVQFVPRTNVVWLAYLLRVLSQRAHGPSKRYFYVKNSSKVSRALQKEMWDALAEVENVVRGVDPNDSDSDKAVKGDERGPEFSEEELARTPGSARELLARAVEEGWVTEEEIGGLKGRLEEDS